MAGTNSTRAVRPRKPRPDYPLYAHASGQWAKKIKGKLHYFGSWSNPDAALAKYVHERDDLYAGRKPRPRTEDGLAIKLACNSFLTSKQRLVEQGERSPRHFDDLERACVTLADAFGRQRMVEDLRPDDFSELRERLSEKWGTHGLKREITNIRSVLNWCYKNDLIDRPVKFGMEFSPPDRKLMRRERKQRGKRNFTARQINDVLDAAGPVLKAMILLGINCGLGNTDIAFLTLGDLDLDAGFLDSVRRKTGVDRRAKLWPETIAAIEHAKSLRPDPKDAEHAGIVFITSHGKPWGCAEKSDSPITKEFRKLLDATEIYRRGLSFYSLRHSFRTVADETKDQPAIDLAMGHDRGDMPSNYRQEISDQRLEDVAKYVRQWLFGPRKPK